MRIEKKLSNYLEKIIKIELNSGDRFNGQITNILDDYVIIALVSDFHFDGLAYIQLSKIKEVFFTDKEEFFTSLFLSRNSMKNALSEPPRKLSVFLENMLQSKKFIACELVDEIHFGKLKSVDENSIIIETVDLFGVLDGTIELGFDEIDYFSTDKEYVSVYEDFVRANQ